MGFIRFLVWTSMCIGLGVFAASYEVDGKTPAQHIRAIWKAAPHPDLDLDGAVAKAKKHLQGHDPAPVERHSASDKAAVERLVAKRTTK